MGVFIENMQSKIPVTDNINTILNRSAELSLLLVNFPYPSEISILLVDNEEIEEINSEQRKINKPTDVLSFPLVDIMEGKINSLEGDFDMDENLLLLGDIVISMEKAAEQAEDYGHSFERELAFLATHGMFHLLGYDHEDEEQEKRMMEKQEAVLELMALKR